MTVLSGAMPMTPPPRTRQGTTGSVKYSQKRRCHHLSHFIIM